MLARHKAKQLSDKIGISIPASVIRQLPNWEQMEISEMIHLFKLVFQSAEK